MILVSRQRERVSVAEDRCHGPAKNLRQASGISPWRSVSFSHLPFLLFSLSHLLFPSLPPSPLSFIPSSVFGPSLILPVRASCLVRCDDNSQDLSKPAKQLGGDPSSSREHTCRLQRRALETLSSWGCAGWSPVAYGKAAFSVVPVNLVRKRNLSGQSTLFSQVDHKVKF